MTQTFTIEFEHPIKKAYEVEASSKEVAVAIAIDTVKRTNPSLDMSNPLFIVDGIKMKLRK